MAANTQPLFTLTPEIGTGILATTNTNRDGTGTLVTVATGTTEGTRVDRITFTQNVGSICSNGMIRLFIYNGSTTVLFAELPVVATTPSGTVAGWTGTMVFDSNPGLSQKRKIFYPPDVTLETGNYEMLFFGTGDREHPKNVMFENRLYAIKDTNSSQALTENALVDVTDEKATLNALSTKSGWYIRLENSGEKSLSNSVVFAGVVYYTTFTPTFGDPGDICALKEGEGRLYPLKYKSGSAAFNLDDSLDGVISQPTDQSEIIGPSIPSGVIITFIGGTTTAYVGVGGGVYIPPIKNNKSIIPIHWRTVTK